MEKTISKTTEKKKKERIILFDLLRGIILILIMLDHFLYDAWGMFGNVYKTEFFQKLYEFSRETYWDGLYRAIVRPVCLFILFFISGILTNFSKSNILRTLKYLFVTLLIFGVSYVATLYTGMDCTITIGVMYVFTVCSLFGFFAKKFNIKSWILVVLGIIFSIIGLLYYFEKIDFLGEKLYFLVYNKEGFKHSADYFFLFPFLGYYLLGIVASRIFYKEKKAYIKFPSALRKVVSPFTFIGRTSLWWYVLSQGVFIAFFYIAILLGA